MIASAPLGLETILFAVTGMSPAVITETIWALAHEPEPIIPARVIVVTTAAGRGELERQLFTSDPRFGGRCPWDALRDSLAALGHELTGRLRFGTTADDVRVITATDPHTGRSHELADLRTPADNAAAADFLLEQLRGLVENPDTRVVASLAGGRKTMGALLYACMTLVGRETDRLTHVLVDEPYDALAGFWFPGQPGGALPRPARGSRPALTAEPAAAVVEVADVPFVPLRNLFHRELGQTAGTFSRLLDLCRVNVRISAGEHLNLEVGRTRRDAIVNGRRLELAPREHLVLLFFADRAKRGETIVSSYDEILGDLNAFRAELRASAPQTDWSDWRNSSQLNADFDERNLTRVLSDLRTKARRTGGDVVFLADVLPSKGRCALDVPGPRIFIKD